MSRKITQESCNAFHLGRKFKKANMEVEVENVILSSGGNNYTRVAMYLHGNCIARYNHDGKWKTEITDAGWSTTTTKERLNGLDGVSIYQKKWVWYLNGKELTSEYYERQGYSSRLKWITI